jgi:hypothetical protein
MIKSGGVSVLCMGCSHSQPFHQRRQHNICTLIHQLLNGGHMLCMLQLSKKIIITLLTYSVICDVIIQKTIT